MMTRKQFLHSLAGLGAGAFVIACSKSDGEPEPVLDAPARPIDAPPVMADALGPDAPPTNMVCASTMTMISANHGHVAVVPGADIAAGVSKTYDIKGASGHPHSITVTAAMFTMLKAGTAVVATSTMDAGHMHNVTITCA